MTTTETKPAKPAKPALERISFSSAGAIRKGPPKRLSDEELAARFADEIKD